MKVDCCFNPRLPGERRLPYSPMCSASRPFQSTPSGGKATRRVGHTTSHVTVSIHAFRGKGDNYTPLEQGRRNRFNPRLPGERRLPSVTRHDGQRQVSIHAFRGKGDCNAASTTRRANSVSIHAFRGKGDRCLPFCPVLARFQSTPSGGKATFCRCGARQRRRRFNPRLPGERRRGGSSVVGHRLGVSIHAFRGKGDQQGPHVFWSTCGFNPRLPGERRLFGLFMRAAYDIVSIHAFRGKGDPQASRFLPTPGSFNPRLPGERRQCDTNGQCQDTHVSIHAFRGKGDRMPSVTLQLGVSIHAFRGKGDRTGTAGRVVARAFQSTPSGGKATALVAVRWCLK